MNDFSHFLVVIATRNRSSFVSAAIKSILELDYPNFDLCLVDQSEDDHTRTAVQPFLDDPRFHYVASLTRGCSGGRNAGIRLLAKEFIAITDDDCLVPPNWLHEMNRAFRQNARIGVVGGSTIAGEFDQAAGFIPTYECKASFLATKINQARQVRAIGACYAIKFQVWQDIFFFDEMLGTGAPFKSSSEEDFTAKALLAGYYVYETPAIFVIHNGFRTWHEGRALAKRNWFGLGAVHAKYFKRRKWFILGVIAYVFGTLAIGSFLKNLFVFRKVRGLTPVIYYCRGFITGLFTRIDPATGNYLNKGREKTQPISLESNGRHAQPPHF